MSENQKPLVELEFRKGEPAKQEPEPEVFASLRFLSETERLQIAKFLKELPTADRHRLKELLAPLLEVLPMPHWAWFVERLD